MYLWCNILLAGMFLTAANAAASIGYFTNPEHPGKCYLNETLIMSPGDVHYQHGCIRITCSSEKGLVNIVSCGVAAAAPNCTIVYPRSNENYPHCCLIAIRCDQDNQLPENSKQTHKIQEENTEKTTEATETTDSTTDSTMDSTTEYQELTTTISMSEADDVQDTTTKK